MTDTPRLGLPLIDEAQESPEIKLGVAFYIVDALCQGVVISRLLTAPPGGEQEGDAYIPATGASGAWAGHVDEVAVFQGGGWRFYEPKTGWELWSLADFARIRFGVEGSPSTWTVAQDGGQIAVSVPGSPSFLVDEVTQLNFVNCDVTDEGGGVVTITPNAGSGVAALTSYDPTASGLAATNVQDAIDELADGAGGGGNVTADTHPGSPNAQDDEFEAGSLDAKWTWRNQGGATATLNRGSLVLTAPAASGNNQRIIEQTVSGAGRWQAKIGAKSGNVGFNAYGLGFVNTGSGKTEAVAGAINSGPKYGVIKMNSVSSFNSNVNQGATQEIHGAFHQYKYFEVEYDGTNIIFRISATGVEGSFMTILSETAATFLGTPDRVFLFAESNHASEPAIAIVDWFRKVA